VYRFSYRWQRKAVARGNYVTGKLHQRVPCTWGTCEWGGAEIFTPKPERITGFREANSYSIH
jgi:hypothetical protein